MIAHVQPGLRLALVAAMIVCATLACAGKSEGSVSESATVGATAQSPAPSGAPAVGASTGPSAGVSAAATAVTPSRDTAPMPPARTKPDSGRGKIIGRDRAIAAPIDSAHTLPPAKPE